MTTSSISFNQDEIDTAQEEFSKVNLEENQRKLVEEVAQILESEININLLALKGFMLRAAKQWQKNNNAPIHELANKSPSDRIKAVREIIGYLKNSLERILSDPSNLAELDNAIQEAWKTYLKKYAGRE